MSLIAFVINVIMETLVMMMLIRAVVVVLLMMMLAITIAVYLGSPVTP